MTNNVKLTYSVSNTRMQCIQKILQIKLSVPLACFINYTKCDVRCHRFQLSCLILVVNCGVVSPTLNFNPTLFYHSLSFLEGDYRFTLTASIVTLQMVSSSKFQSSMTIFHHKLLTSLDLWMNSSINHDNSCSLSLEKCHLKSYQNDINYHIIALRNPQNIP